MLQSVCWPFAPLCMLLAINCLCHFYFNHDNKVVGIHQSWTYSIPHLRSFPKRLDSESEQCGVSGSKSQSALMRAPGTTLASHSPGQGESKPGIFALIHLLFCFGRKQAKWKWWWVIQSKDCRVRTTGNCPAQEEGKCLLLLSVVPSLITAMGAS